MIVQKNYTFDFSKIKTIGIGSSSVKYIGFVNSNNTPSGLGATYSET